MLGLEENRHYYVLHVEYARVKLSLLNYRGFSLPNNAKQMIILLDAHLFINISGRRTKSNKNNTIEEFAASRAASPSGWKFDL